MKEQIQGCINGRLFLRLSHLMMQDEHRVFEYKNNTVRNVFVYFREASISRVYSQSAIFIPYEHIYLV